MKNCRETQIQLSAYIDHELSKAARDAVEKHVQDCGVCRERLAELEALTAGVVALPRLQPPPGFLAEVRLKVMRDSKDQPSWQGHLFRPLWLKVPLEAVAVIAIGLLVMQAERSVNEHSANHKALLSAEEPASAPVVSEAKPRSIQKLGPNRLVGNDTSSLADTAAGNTIVVHIKDFDDAKNRIQQLASTMNGRIVPSPLAKTSTRTLFVELPPENVEAFKSQLQNAAPPISAPEPSPESGSTSVAGEAGHSGKTSSRVVVQIQVLTPAD